MQTRKKILAVDDNIANLEVIEELFGEQYELKTVSSGQDALTAAQEFQPDMILLDIMMPGIDGYEVCRRIRMTPNLRYTKIIIVSAKAMASERIKGYQAGADDYFTKPFEGDELLAKVRAYLRLKSVKEAEQSENEILANVCFKTNTPLNNIIRLAQSLMSDEDSDTSERKKSAEEIYNSAKEMQNFFEQIIPTDVRNTLKTPANLVTSGQYS